MPTLDFKGKQHIYAHHLTVPYKPLKPDENLSCNSLALTIISSFTTTTCMLSKRYSPVTPTVSSAFTSIRLTILATKDGYIMTT